MKKKQKSKVIQNKKLTQQMTIYVIIIYLVSASITLINLFITHGESWSSIFFHDSLDTGMDFFHSIEYTRGRSPYELFETLYPPLANLFFYILYRLVPFWQSRQWTNTFYDGVAARGTKIDLRVWQPTMILFMLFIIIASMLFLFLAQKLLTKLSYSNLVSLCILLSYSILYAFERGNIIIVSMLCSIIFIQYKDSKNKIVQELALIALAISAGLKIYPAALGVILLYDKQYYKAMRTVLYGIAAFILPVFVFHEGINGIGQFFNILTSFSSSSEFSTSGYSFDRLISTIVVIVNPNIHTSYTNDFFVDILPKFNLLFSLATILCGFSMKKKWQQILSCCLAIIIIQPQGVYTLVYLVIPLLFFIYEEQTISKKNIIPFFALVVPQLILPQIDLENKLLSFTNIRLQLCVWTLFFYLIIITSQNISIFFIKLKRKAE